MSTELTVVQQVRRTLDKMEPELRTLLPAHIPPAQFIRIAQTAMQMNEDLQLCTPKSVIGACTKAAEAGLVPDGDEAALVAYNVKVSKKGQPDRWEKQAKFMPMVRGIRKQVQQSGMCKDWKVRLVYAQDHFEHIDGDVETLTHRPAYVEDDHPVIVYSIAYLENGELSRHVMRMGAVEKIRRRSRSAERGPWVTDYEEMVKKTCLRQHSKALPRSKDNIAQQRFMGSIRALDDAEAVIEDKGRVEPLPLSMHEAASQRLREAVEVSDFEDAGDDDRPAAVVEHVEAEVVEMPAQQQQRKRRTAADRLAEAEEGRKQRLAAYEQKQAAKHAGKLIQQAAPEDEARDYEFEQQAADEASEDPLPAGFRDQAPQQGPSVQDRPEAAAFRDGWDARFVGKTRTPPTSLVHSSDVKAWLKGYDAAQQSVDIGNAPGSPQASRIMCDNLIAKMFA
jgi:recombination protein RecT